MEAKIIVHKSHNKFYYYYQKSYRVKNDPKDNYTPQYHWTDTKIGTKFCKYYCQLANIIYL